jgi:hypothetical protein
MITYVEFDDDDEEDGMFLIATHNMSLLVTDLKHLLSIEGKYTIQVQMGKLFFAHLAKLDQK